MQNIFHFIHHINFISINTVFFLNIYIIYLRVCLCARNCHACNYTHTYRWPLIVRLGFVPSTNKRSHSRYLHVIFAHLPWIIYTKSKLKLKYIWACKILYIIIQILFSCIYIVFLGLITLSFLYFPFIYISYRRFKNVRYILHIMLHNSFWLNKTMSQTA